MYGLVNRAIEGLVCRDFGDEAWTRIKDKAGWTGTSFVSMETYPDELTYSLVGAASEELGLEASTVLEAFGEYWTSYTIEEGYGTMLSAMGNSLEDFLDNLDSLHARVGLSMPGLVPPSFEREPQADGSWLLYYESERAGLAPMVTGLLRGLVKRFSDDVTIEMVDSSNPQRATFKLVRQS